MADLRAARKSDVAAVNVLSVSDDAAQVTGGVKPGEKIVALGAHLLHDGEAVRLAEQRGTAQAGSQP